MKQIRKYMAGTMAAVCAVTTAGGGLGIGNDMKVVKAADNTQEIEKDESVYVLADTTGKVKSTTVTEWLKGVEYDTISDVSRLNDIKNIKGDELFTIKGEDIQWNAAGDDIYYQGTTSESLPVGVNISYRLDGKEISPEKLKGKSGKLEIHIQYKNYSKIADDLFTPFAMMTAMILPADQYQNVSIDHGKIISDAEREIVVGIGFPGLKESLQADSLDLEIPEEVTITADVKEASVGETFTMATTEVFNELDTDKLDGFDDLEASMAKLESATEELVNGSVELAEGAKELSEGAKTLKDGTLQLQSGTSQLTAKVPELVNGAGQLNAGAAALLDGVNAYTGGVDMLKAEMEAGNLVAGAKAASAGAAGVKQYVDGMNAALTTYDAQISSAADPTALMTAIGAFQSAAPSISAAPQVNGDVYTNVSITYGEILSSDQCTALGVNPDDVAYSTTKNVTADVNNAVANGVIAASSADLAQAQAAAGQIANAASNYAVSAQTVAAVTAGLKGAMNGNGTAQNPGLVAASAALADNSTGLPALAAGVEAVKAGVDQIADGSAALKNGVTSLCAGTSQLNGGAGTLSQGAAALKNGVDQLAAGSTALSEGAEKLSTGTDTLKDGMAEYKKEAIDKLTSMADHDILKMTKRLEKIVNAGKAYQSFAGITGSMNGTTRFIIETEGVE